MVHGIPLLLVFYYFWSPLGALWAPILLIFTHCLHRMFRFIFRHLSEPYFSLFFIDFRLLFELFSVPGGKVNSMLSLQREHRNYTLAPSKIHTFSDTVPGPPFPSIFDTFWYPSGIQLDPPNQLFRYFLKHVFLYVFGRPPSSDNLGDRGHARPGIVTLSSPLSDSPPSLTPAVGLMLYTGR